MEWDIYMVSKYLPIKYLLVVKRRKSIQRSLADITLIR